MISHEHRTIFIHIPKTGGQSVTLAFLTALGKTWDDRRDLRMLPEGQPRPKDAPPALMHMFAREYVSLGIVSQEVFDSYLKFTIVRNPWARFVSAYKFSIRRQGEHWRRLSFEDFVEGRFVRSRRVLRHIAPQWKFFCDRNGKPIVDYILRFEGLSEGFPEFSRRIFGKPQPLPAINVSSDRTDYRSFYNDETAEKIARKYEADIKSFDYTFDPRPA